MSLETQGGTCPFAASQKGGGGTADYAVSVVGNFDKQSALEGQGNLIAMKGAGRSRRRKSTLKSLLQRIKRISSKKRTIYGGRRRNRGKKSRKNYSRRRH